MGKLVQGGRVFLFYLLWIALSLVWAPISFVIVLCLRWPARVAPVVKPWSTATIWLARWIAGVSYRVEGLENLPEGPCVILSKHQSTWETVFLSSLMPSLSNVLKRELMYIPLFGWVIALLRPIIIDRSHPKKALKALSAKGELRLQAGVKVLIFPEGTRVPPGQMGRFSRGGAALAAHRGVPVVPVAHNAGEFWPKKGWIKHRGTISVVIGPAMRAKTDSNAAIQLLNQQAESWVAETMARISSLHEASTAVADGEHKDCAH